MAADEGNGNDNDKDNDNKAAPAAAAAAMLMMMMMPIENLFCGYSLPGLFREFSKGLCSSSSIMKNAYLKIAS